MVSIKRKRVKEQKAKKHAKKSVIRIPNPAPTKVDKKGNKTQ